MITTLLQLTIGVLAIPSAGLTGWRRRVDRVICYLLVVGAAALPLLLGGCTTSNDAYPSFAASTTGTGSYWDGNVWTRAGNRPGSQSAFRQTGFEKQADGQYRDMGVNIPILDPKKGMVTFLSSKTTTTAPDGTITVEEEYAPAAVNVYNSDPTNGTVEGFDASLPGGITLKIAKAGFDNSTVIAAYNEQIIAALEAAEKITAEQAAVARAGIAAGQTLGEALISAGVSVLTGGVGAVPPAVDGVTP